MAERSKSQVILFVVLLVSGGYLGYDMVFNKESSTKELIKQKLEAAKKPVQQAANTASSNINTSIKPKQIQPTKAEKIPSYATVWGRDPFVGMITKVLVINKTEKAQEEDPIYIEDYILSAISYRGDSPVVLINDSVLRVGDKIDKLTLKEVRATSVVLVSPNGKEYILNLQTTAMQ